MALISGLPGDAQAEFWRDMHPYGAPAGLTASVARQLLKHRRPWSAIRLLSHAGFGSEVDLALEALTGPLDDAEEDLTRNGSPEYSVGRLLDRLQEAGTDDARLAGLEWYYQPLLDHNRAPQALYRELARAPGRFAPLVSFIYPPDPGPDPAEEEEEEEAASARASGAAWAVLRGWRTPPPGSSDGQLPTSDEMLRWVVAARDLLTASGRARVLPIVLGDALSGSSTDEDGTWPSEAVRDVLEVLADIDLGDHLAIARMNQRGVTTRGV